MVDNVYPFEGGADIMGRASIAVALIVLIAPMGVFATVSTAQTNIIPEISITCDDPPEMEVYEGATRTVISNCVLENPTIYSEKVDITVQAGGFVYAAPASVTVGAGSDVSFEVVFRGDVGHTPGSYVANITAQVTEANGIQVGFITSPESSEVTIVVAEYSGCTASVGQGGGSFEAGEVVSFSVSISCESNTDSKVSYRAVMIEDGSSSSSWPSGFDDQSPDCEVSVEGGGASKNCQFQIMTPSNLDSVWEGCVFVIETTQTTPSICPNGNSLQIEVEPKGVGLDTLGLGGNESLSEILQENKEIVAGGGALLLVFVAVALLRRSRRDSYDD
mgnify:FL=1